MAKRVLPSDWRSYGELRWLNPPAEPMSLDAALALAAKPLPWQRESIPTGKDYEKWLEAMVREIPENVAFYHPGLGCNVLKQEGNLLLISDPLAKHDVAYWVETLRMKGTAPVYREDDEEVDGIEYEAADKREDEVSDGSA